MTLLAELQTKLYLRYSELIGCTRRNRWAEEIVQWRSRRGNALLLLAADDVAVLETPAGFVDLPIHYTSSTEAELLQFRGGTWKAWWEEDIQLLLAVSRVYSTLGLTGCVVLHEDQGDMTTRYIAAESLTSHVLVAAALKRWERLDRIAKDGPRATTMCPYCPVKERCDAEDLQTGATADWPRLWSSLPT